jgi:hypothetical protein
VGTILSQLRLPNGSLNLRPMPRWLVALILSGAVLSAFACNDETTEVVSKDVCYSEMRWVGEKRGSPEMFPGRDCVGCHIDNDGPQLAVGGTLYSYIMSAEQSKTLQTGTDCFGIEGITLTIEDAEGQLFDVTTNRAGNFYIEGNPDDFKKPFHVTIDGWGLKANGDPQVSSMLTAPMYGGCARCHNPEVPPDPAFNTNPTDAEYRNGQGRIGLPGYSADGPGTPTVVQELQALVEGKTIAP